jgi:RNA ligase (TIGR02306 family)
MATFEVLAKRILEIVSIENADAIELARIDGFYSVVRKNQFSVGQIVLYLPEQAVVPENILQAINLWDYEKGKGKLTAASGAVIKAIKLRGQLSQGIVVDEEVLQTILNDKTFNLVENQDYQETFNITKHVVPIPEHMAGEVFNLGLKIDFDLENIQKYPDVLLCNEDIVVAEKLHGSCFSIFDLGKNVHSETFVDGRIALASKGLGSQGLFFKNNENNQKNTYVRMFNKIQEGMLLALDNWRNKENLSDNAVIEVYGEVFGCTQDLTYGLKENEYRLFAVKSNGRWLTDQEIDEFVLGSQGKILRVPVLFRGKMKDADILSLRTGNTVFPVKQIREGCVIYTQNMRYDAKLGVIMLKAINPDYLTRKNGTEFN